MAYGQIINNLLCAGGPPGVLAQAHTLGSAAFCAFATHDITTAGAAAAGERIYCPTGGTRLAAQVTFNDATVAGMLRFSTYLTTAYSLVDIGPIVTGVTPQTRAAAQVSAFSRAGRPSYRSLHSGVPVVCTAGQVVGNVTIMHLLQTTQLAVYALANDDPFDPGGAPPYGIDDTLRWWFDNPTLTTVDFHVARADGGVFNVTQTMHYDVAVCAQQPLAGEVIPATGAVGPHHSVQHPRYTGTGDYNAGNRVVAPPRASYMAQYNNVDAIVAAPGLGLAHNLGGVARMVLFGPTATPGLNYPYIINSGTSNTVATIGAIGGAATINNCCTAVLRNYSRHIPV